MAKTYATYSPSLYRGRVGYAPTVDGLAVGPDHATEEAAWRFHAEAVRRRDAGCGDGPASSTAAALQSRVYSAEICGPAYVAGLGRLPDLRVEPDPVYELIEGRFGSVDPARTRCYDVRPPWRSR